MKFTASSSLLSLLPTLLLLVDPSSALVLSKRANTPLLSSIASTNTRPQDSSKSTPKYTIEVPRVSQAWCGHTPPAENFTTRPMALPTDAVKHPGSLLFTDAMIRNTLEKAAAVAVNGQALQFGFNKYPRTFKNENRAEWLPRGPMIAGAPGELYEFPIMPSGDPPTMTAGVQAPAGKQGPFRVIYSVSGENPKVFRFYGVTEHPPHSPRDTILCPSNKQAVPSKGNPSQMSSKQLSDAGKKSAQRIVGQRAETSNWNVKRQLKHRPVQARV
ncbi:hypothetical protein P167DRAFT_579891 [Morchella conica CCBAS932]|uniref:Uncharacterized protein n=1 Tax=Morchella conica CCBAS932 TaxID=1392247 RepID=A0A3N4KC11_9PEZI|nr:hypothetical protein P167DRAFT_579891 [Morchella conica CCBAS932]